MRKRGSNSERIDTAERRSLVLSLRKAGHTYREISWIVVQQLGNDGVPSGWDERYAAKDVKRELERLSRDVQQQAVDIRDMELLRLDNMQQGLWERAVGGDTKAILGVLRIMDRRARYLQLHEPEVVRRKGNGALDRFAESMEKVRKAYTEQFRDWDKELQGEKGSVD